MEMEIEMEEEKYFLTADYRIEKRIENFLEKIDLDPELARILSNTICHGFISVS